MPVIDTELHEPSSAIDDDERTDTATSPISETDEPGAAKSTDAPRRVSLSVRTILVAAVMAVLAATAAVFGSLYWAANSKLNAEAREASSRAHAEDVAAVYAVNAADMDYQDFNSWKAKLVKGTSAQLNDKLTKAADSMQQVLAPLQWKSSARPLATKVRSEAGGIYTVDSFVSVMTKTMQAPDGLQSTATYSITVDSNNNWQITDVGGIDAALGK